MKYFQPKHVLFVAIFLTGSMMQQVLGDFVDGEIKCIDRERRALLKFKEDLIDVDGALLSWDTEVDCCKWKGIRCDNGTSHVTSLDFQDLVQGPLNAMFDGKISPSLLELQHLNYLDLSCINISVREVPEFIGQLSRLRYLNLSDVGFEGAIPQKLGNLSKLQYLDLGGFNNHLYSRNLDWLSMLHSLKYIDLTYVNLSLAANWLPALAKAPSLQELHLARCDVPQILQDSQPMINFSSLTVLDLSGNSLLHFSVYSWIFNLSRSLTYVDLFDNNLGGYIPDAFRNMASLSYLSMSRTEIKGGILGFFRNLSLETLSLGYNELEGELPEVTKNLSGHTPNNLKYLDISGNRLSGSVPESITRFPSLIELRLADNRIRGFLPDKIGNLYNLSVLDSSGNQLTGTLPESIGRLSKIENLRVGFNHMEGMVSEVHVFGLFMLRELDLSFNSFQLKISSRVHCPFQLDLILLAKCKQGPQFPEWLRTQHNFSRIDISHARISDTIPDWFWDCLLELRT